MKYDVDELIELIEEATPRRRRSLSRRPCNCGRRAMREHFRDMGLDDEVIEVLMEAVRCDSDCEKKYMKGGRFKGRKGERFENCVRWAEECCEGVTDARALCAAIGRKAGKI